MIKNKACLIAFYTALSIDLDLPNSKIYGLKKNKKF